MFILLVECGLVHRGDCMDCETCCFCFDPAFVWPSLLTDRISDFVKHPCFTKSEMRSLSGNCTCTELILAHGFV